jgi:hypothetical protein
MVRATVESGAVADRATPEKYHIGFHGASGAVDGQYATRL